MRRGWSSGCLENVFHGGLDQYTEQAGFKHVVVILAPSPSAAGWAPPTAGGTYLLLLVTKTPHVQFKITLGLLPL